MLERRFTEVDLRMMLADSGSVTRDVEPGRWVVASRVGRRRWNVIVEPDAAMRRIVVVTAYALE